jgi:hypothetical protein
VTDSMMAGLISAETVGEGAVWRVPAEAEACCARTPAATVRGDGAALDEAGPLDGGGPLDEAGPLDGGGPLDGAVPLDAAGPLDGAGPFDAAAPLEAAAPLDAAGPTGGRGVTGAECDLLMASMPSFVWLARSYGNRFVWRHGSTFVWQQKSPRA